MWLIQKIVEETKQKIYEQTNDERVYWLSPVELIKYIKQKKLLDYKEKLSAAGCLNKLDELIPHYIYEWCAMDYMMTLFSIVDVLGLKRVMQELTLRVISNPENTVPLSNIKYVLDKYYSKLDNARLDDVPVISQYLKKYRIRKYYRFYIPRKNGKKRMIETPCADLKKLQQVILKKILYRNPVWKTADSMNGFVPDKNILTNASLHKNSKLLLKLDIKNAFTSTKQDMVQNALKPYFTELGAKIISKLCCYRGYLPQGAPTSGMLLNYVLLEPDAKIKKITNNTGWNYSRYCDDLCFSIPQNTEPEIGIKTLIEKVKTILKQTGYKINNQKTCVFKQNRAMKITGLVLNSGSPTISRNYRRIVRAKVHNFLTKATGNINHINGCISYINLVHPEYANKLKEKLQQTHFPANQ